MADEPARQPPQQTGGVNDPYCESTTPHDRAGENTQRDAPPAQPTVLPANAFSGEVNGCYFGTSNGTTGYMWDANRANWTRHDSPQLERARLATVSRQQRHSASSDHDDKARRAADQKQLRLQTALAATARRKQAAVGISAHLPATSYDWQLVDAESPTSEWSGWSTAVGSTVAIPKLHSQCGIPAERLREFTLDEVRHDGEILVDQAGWCRMPQHAAHPNGSIPEHISAVSTSPDPVVYQSNVTDHVDIDCWETKQIAAATAAGATFHIRPGPTAEGGFGRGPQTWEEMHINPDASWNRACKAVADSADQIEDLIERDIPLRPNRVEGGKEGVRCGLGALHPP